MALVKCKECGQEVSQKAGSCPKCGAPLKHKLGWVGKLLIILLVGYLAYDLYLRNGPETKLDSVPSIKPSSTILPSATPTMKTEQMEYIFKEGKNVCLDEFCFTVWKSWWSDSLGKDLILHSVKPDSKYLFIDMTIQNNDHRPRLIRNFQIVDQNGSTYELSSDSWLAEGSMGIYGKINPSVSKRGIFVYDLPQNRQYYLKLISNMFRTNAAYVQLDPKDSMGSNQ
jgi:hypothetical protein